jgi:hypothetical protein
MKGTVTNLNILIISFFLLQGCAVPFASGFQVKDVIQTVNGVRNIQKISEPAVREELITETKNILRDIQSGGKTQR